MAGAREERRQRSQLCRSSGLSGGPELEWRLEMGWRQRLSHGRHRHHQPPVLFVPATAPHAHMTKHSAGMARPVSSVALRGGGIASLLVCTCGVEPSVNTASCPGTWAQRGAGRCGTVLLRHGATRGTPSPQQHSCSPPQPLVHGTWATWCRSPQPKLPSERSSHGAVSSVQYCQGPAPAPATAEHNCCSGDNTRPHIVTQDTHTQPHSWASRQPPHSPSVLFCR